MAKDLGQVEQSPADDRAYRALELENGLQASTLRLGTRVGRMGMMMLVCVRIVGFCGALKAGTFCKDHVCSRRPVFS